MVEKLYLHDPYASESEATVTDVRDGKVYLSRTIFYPEGGGQLGDTGTIGGARITDTQKFGGTPFDHPEFTEVINLGGKIIHYVDTPEPEGLQPGQDVHLSIDWDRRYRIMRGHSGSHLAFWYAMKARPEMQIKGCRIDENNARFDFRTADRLEPDEIAEWEHLSNEAIAKDLEIERKPVDGQEEAFMWLCEDMRIPCGGTHVRSTKEIGGLKLRRKRQGANLERLYVTLVDD
jgi:alanyl-tRNA synthetase